VDAAPGPPPIRDSEEDWLRILSGAHPGYRWGRNMFRRLPATPRCKLCAAPFAGAGGHLMRLIGKRPWPKNPKFCGSCLSGLSKHRGGAEIACSLLFADVRGSTVIAEQMRPAEFRALMDRFYIVATDVLVDHDSFVDKFVGDEVIGLFIPMLTGERHAARAIEASRALLAAVRTIDTERPLAIGAGVHTGTAFVGTVGAGDDLNFTALGDTVNTTARLASAAGAGEALVSEAAAQAARLDSAGLERRTLALKGKSESVGVVVLTA
jgi:adenylate cyclase